MGIYSSERYASVNLEDAGIIECQYSNMHEAALNIVAESQFNFGLIMKHIGISELAEYEKTGKDVVYESGSIEGFFTKIKEFFMNIWEKIKGLFKRFFAMFDSYVKSDKDFINKYKKDLFSISHSLKDFKYKGYKFDFAGKDDIEGVNDRIISVIDSEVCKIDDVATDSAAEKIKKAKEDSDTIVEKMRGAAIKSGGGELTTSEFTKELHMLFRSGEESKEELENPNINDIAAELEGAAKAKKSAEDAMKGLEKAINKIITDFKKLRNDLIKKMPNKSDSEQHTEGVSNQNYLSNVIGYTQFARDQLDILQVYNGALLNALKDRSRQNKAICVSLLHYKPKKENASSWTHESSFLGGVNFK